MWLLLSLFILSYYPSFFSLVCGLMMLYWQFLGYYDQYFVAWLIGALGVSCLLDCAYVFLWVTGSAGKRFE